MLLLESCSKEAMQPPGGRMACPMREVGSQGNGLSSLGQVWQEPLDPL
jgi:hypothetical protein